MRGMVGMFALIGGKIVVSYLNTLFLNFGTYEQK